MLLSRSHDWVDIPLGLVGLYWIKLYQPLILRRQLRQLPGSANYGFAKEAYYRLANISPLDLRVGQPLDGEFGATVLQAIRDACRTIVQMPAHYNLCRGATGRSSMPAQPARRSDPVRSCSGRRRLPASARAGCQLWDCCSRYACWLEPAIVNEWAELMQSYQVRDADHGFLEVLQWEEGRRRYQPGPRIGGGAVR